jgi:hypothetical protein
MHELEPVTNEDENWLVFGFREGGEKGRACR